MATPMSPQSFCDFSDSTESTSISTGTVLRDLSPRSSFMDGPSEVSSPIPPRIEVDWPNTPPLSLSLRLSGLFDDSILSADVTRETHRSRSPIFDMSHDIQSFPNIKDINMDFGPDNVSDVFVLSHKIPSTLSTIPEATEPSPVLAYTTTLSDFDVLTTLDNVESETRVMICQRKKSGKVYKIRARRIYDKFPWIEQDILETLRDVGAPFLPHLKSVFREDNHMNLVLDYSASTSLRELTGSYATLGSQRVLFYACELVTGVSHLHAVGIVHRNLNPDDILLDQHGHILITNFEFANFIKSPRNNGAPFNCDLLLTPKFQAYQAPEMVLGWAHDLAVDCWGFGVLLYFMCFGKHPFQEDRRPVDHRVLRNRIIQGSLSPESLRLIHPQTRDLILKCIERNPSIRLTVEGIKKHPYFANVPWAKVADKVVEVPPLPGNGFGREILGKPGSSGLRQSLSFKQPGDASPVDSEHRSLRASRLGTLSPRPTLHSPSVSALAESCISKSIDGNLSLHSPKPRTFRPFLNTQANTQSSKGEQITSGMEIWDVLDQEERESATSGEFGKAVLSFFKPKFRNLGLRKHGSSSSLLKTFFLNLSTTSITQNLRKRETRVMKPHFPNSPSPGDLGVADLPDGVEKIGSGIGFQHTLSGNATGSRTSVHSPPPRFCHGGMFRNRFSLGLKSRARKGSIVSTNESVDDNLVSPVPLCSPCDVPSGLGDLHPAFRQIERPLRSPTSVSVSTPPWPGSPHPHPLHDGLPQPLLLATEMIRQDRTDSPSPLSSHGPFTPTTVACNDDCHEQMSDDIDMIKEVDLETGVQIVDGFVHKVPSDLTLRLVTPRALRQVSG